MAKVLLAGHDAPLGLSVLHRLGKLDISGEWVRSAAELDAWAALLHRGPAGANAASASTAAGGSVSGGSISSSPVQTRQSLRGVAQRELARASQPSLVLLDWELPGAAPGEPLGVLQTLLPSATIVVLSEGLTGDDAAVLLSRGVPSIHKPVHPFVLSTLALDLATEPAATSGGSTDFENLVAEYAASRRLSKQQALILDLYLSGKSDKEIAELCACSGATVYEHWRRMARKSGGRQKSDIIADFHRYLRGAPPGAPAAVAPSAPAPSFVVQNFGLG